MSGTVKLDVLAIGAHPDDVELGCGGTIRSMVDQGNTVGIIDLTEGELGSRGSVKIRYAEAAEAGRILGIASRDNLRIPDGGIENSRNHQVRIIEAVRRHQPDIVFIGAPECRHPDHGDATKLCISALFYSGLRKIELDGNAGELPTWRPSHVLHYMQSVPFEPTFVVDVTSAWPARVAAVHAYKSQFHVADYERAENEPDTFISTPGFMAMIESRARSLGYRVGAELGEGFLYHNGPVGTDNLGAMLAKRRIA